MPGNDSTLRSNPVPTFILTMLAFALATSAAAQTFTDNNGPTQATYISDEEVKTVLKGAPPAVDQQLKVVDTGKYNVGVGIIHRGKIPARADGSVAGIAHHNQTETYVIVSGTGTLATGGTIVDGKEAPSDGAVYKVLNGPS